MLLFRIFWYTLDQYWSMFVAKHGLISPYYKIPIFPLKPLKYSFKKSRIRETKHPSTNADSSTNSILGWTKNTQKPVFFLNGQKIIQNAKT